MTIFSTCVPLFFFANGYLLFSKKSDFKKHTVKTIRIILLTITWSAITVFVLMFMKHEFLSPHDFFQTVWYHKMWWNHHLWFMDTLICIYIFFPLLKTVFDSNQKVFIYFVGILTLLTFGNILFNQLCSIIKVTFLDSAPTLDKNYLSALNPFQGIRWWTFVYFCLGGIAYYYRDKILQISNKKRNIIALVAIIVNCSLLFAIGLFYSHTTKKLYDVVFAGYNTIFTLCNTLAIFLLCLNYKSNNPVISLISRNTLGIYFIHWILVMITRPYLLQINFLCNLPCSLIYAGIILGASLGISLLIQKIPVVKKLLR